MDKVTGSRLKVAPESDHDIPQLDNGRKIYAKFGLFPVDCYKDVAQKKWLLPT